jgi:hypothetical protein
MARRYPTAALRRELIDLAGSASRLTAPFEQLHDIRSVVLLHVVLDGRIKLAATVIRAGTTGRPEGEARDKGQPHRHEEESPFHVSSLAFRPTKGARPSGPGPLVSDKRQHGGRVPIGSQRRAPPLVTDGCGTRPGARRPALDVLDSAFTVLGFLAPLYERQ